MECSPPQRTGEPHSVSRRRQAWARSRDQWQSLKEKVLIEGSSDDKIKSWLQDCGATPETNRDTNSPPRDQDTVGVRGGNSFEDDLSLGAEAMLLPNPKLRTVNTKACLESFGESTVSSSLSSSQYTTTHAKLVHMGSSKASSRGTVETVSSISEILDLFREDPEETLYNLGFGREEPNVTAKIPSRFFSSQSQANGMNFRVFLEAQSKRLGEESPSFTLASRFRQIEALTMMANALTSLYSHVSKTPLPKIVSPCQFPFNFDLPLGPALSAVHSNYHNNNNDAGGDGNAHGNSGGPRSRSEQRSPSGRAAVQKLRKTVTKLCLYGASREPESPHRDPAERREAAETEDPPRSRGEAGDSPGVSLTGTGFPDGASRPLSPPGGSRDPPQGGGRRLTLRRELWRSETGRSRLYGFSTESEESVENDLQPTVFDPDYYSSPPPARAPQRPPLRGSQECPPSLPPRPRAAESQGGPRVAAEEETPSPLAGRAGEKWAAERPGSLCLSGSGRRSLSLARSGSRPHPRSHSLPHKRGLAGWRSRESLSQPQEDSFDLEEVQSNEGEGQNFEPNTLTCSTAASTVRIQKGLGCREASIQSDSSGFVEDLCDLLNQTQTQPHGHEFSASN